VSSPNRDLAGVSLTLMNGNGALDRPGTRLLLVFQDWQIPGSLSDIGFSFDRLPGTTGR